MKRRHCRLLDPQPSITPCPLCGNRRNLQDLYESQCQRCGVYVVQPQTKPFDETPVFDTQGEVLPPVQSRLAILAIRCNGEDL